MEYAGDAMYWLLQFLILLLCLLGAGAFASLLRGSFELRRRARDAKRDHSEILLKSPLVPPVSTIAVPMDASAASRQFARRLLDLHFGRNEVVIVLDGPSELELETWTRELRLVPSARAVDQELKTAQVRGIYESKDPVRAVVVDKEKGGRADAWNAGVNVSASPILGFLDPESEFEPFVLLKLIQPLLESSETIAVCAGGPIPPADGLVAQFGALESLRAWLTRGAAFAARNMVLPIPGSCVMARRSTIVACGGFTAEVFELVVRLHAFGMASKKPYRIAFLPEPISYGRNPGNLTELRRLSARDQRQIANAYLTSKTFAGPFGSRILEGLYLDRSIRPKIEVATYILMVTGLVAGWVHWSLAALLVMATAGIGVVLSMGAVVLREVARPDAADPGRALALFFAAVAENFGYRQFRNFWLIAGFRRYGPKNRIAG